MSSLPRKRGAQPNNTNSLKHGIYSRHIAQSNTVVDERQLASMPLNKNDDELALARVRLKEFIGRQDGSSPEDYFKYEKAIQHYFDKIISITHKNAVLGKDNSQAFITVMAMIRQSNEEQDVK